ncbi:MAG: Gfo/Idh/MocA family protein, partial [Mangrovicoccus sp.]
MQTVNYGLIGCGMMGQEHMRNIALLAGARVAAIFDPDDEQAGLALKIAPNAKRLASLQDLLEFPELDALVIASPNFLHISQLVEIGRKRPLPVLVEKPLFTQ